MFNNIKIFKDIKDNRYSIVYHTNINKFIKHWYWYDDISDILCKFDCIMISSIHIPERVDYSIGVKFLKEFCNIMTAGNKIIIFDMEELINTNDIDYICDIENLLCRCDFINIPVNDIEVYDTYVYINTHGTDLLNMVDAKHGVYYD